MPSDLYSVAQVDYMPSRPSAALCSRSQVANSRVDFDTLIDFSTGRWSTQRSYELDDFPLLAASDGRRYELYSDGTFLEI